MRLESKRTFALAALKQLLEKFASDLLATILLLK